MGNFTKHGLLFLAFFCAFASAISPPTASAQSADKNAARQKTFGWSLKQNKADAAARQHGAAMTEKSGEKINEKSDDKSDESGLQTGEAIRVETLLAVSDVSVTDRSGARYITGLGKDDFVVTEDGQAQQIATLADDSSCLPRSIVLVLDRSQSQLPYLEESIEAAKKLVGQLTRTDEMAIVTDDVQLVADFTKDRKQLKATLDSLKKLTLNGFHSRSQQFSALLATLRELTAAKELPVIIFQTDGDEAEWLNGEIFVQRSQAQPKDYNLADIYAAAEKSRVKIYTVIPGDKLIGLSPEETAERVRLINEKSRRAQEKYPDMWEDRRRLPPLAETSAKSGAVPNAQALDPRDARIKQSVMELLINAFVRNQEAAAHVAELTGGWASFLEKPEQAKDIYARILADIDHRYIIGYYPTNKVRDGRLRKVHIEVRNHPEYIVHGRDSYYVEMAH